MTDHPSSKLSSPANDSVAAVNNEFAFISLSFPFRRESNPHNHGTLAISPFRFRKFRWFIGIWWRWKESRWHSSGTQEFSLEPLVAYSSSLISSPSKLHDERWLIFPPIVKDSTMKGLRNGALLIEVVTGLKMDELSNGVLILSIFLQIWRRLNAMTRWWRTMNIW